MKYLEKRFSLKKKLSLVALAGAMALPVFAATPQAAQADPPRWGHREDRRDNRRWNRDRNRDRNRRNNISIYGRVIDSRNVRNQLRIRADNGRVYTVPTNSARYYRVGDRVRVSGDLHGSMISNARISR